MFVKNVREFLAACAAGDAYVPRVAFDALSEMGGDEPYSLPELEKLLQEAEQGYEFRDDSDTGPRFVPRVDSAKAYYTSASGRKVFLMEAEGEWLVTMHPTECPHRMTAMEAVHNGRVKWSQVKNYMRAKGVKTPIELEHTLDRRFRNWLLSIPGWHGKGYTLRGFSDAFNIFRVEGVPIYSHAHRCFELWQEGDWGGAEIKALEIQTFFQKLQGLSEEEKTWVTYWYALLLNMMTYQQSRPDLTHQQAADILAKMGEELGKTPTPDERGNYKVSIRCRTEDSVTDAGLTQQLLLWVSPNTKLLKRSWVRERKLWGPTNTLVLETAGAVVLAVTHAEVGFSAQLHHFGNTDDAVLPNIETSGFQMLIRHHWKLADPLIVASKK